jgi:hypothetical protein
MNTAVHRSPNKLKRSNSIFNLCIVQHRFWIGLTSQLSYEGVFSWSDETNFDFSYWASGEPGAAVRTSEKNSHLKVVCNEKGRWLHGKVANVSNSSRTVAIEVCSSYNFAVVFDFKYFRFRQEKLYL